MEITEVKIKLIESPKDRLLGFCSITFDDSFVVRDIKIIQGSDGPFVAMPSRKITDHCPACGSKYYIRSRFCSECGDKLRPTKTPTKLHVDIAHPINTECRKMIQDKILEAYYREQKTVHGENTAPAN